MSSLNSGVYQIVNQVNGKRYIGSSENLHKREKDHFRDLKNNKHDNPHLQNSYNKNGIKRFIFEVIMHCKKNDCVFFEQIHIDEYDFKELYNICPIAGSCLGVKRSEATREKQSKAHKGKKKSPESIEKSRQFHIGKKLSEETKKKIGNYHKGKLVSKETRKKISEGNKGKKQSPESIEKTRQANIGRKYSPETIEKMSKAKKGKKQSPEHIENRRQAVIGKNNKPVKAYDYKTGGFVGEYDSQKECAEKLNLNKTAISNILGKRQKQSKGYTFR